jgi:hypothetical protein
VIISSALWTTYRFRTFCDNLQNGETITQIRAGASARGYELSLTDNFTQMSLRPGSINPVAPNDECRAVFDKNQALQFRLLQ